MKYLKKRDNFVIMFLFIIIFPILFFIFFINNFELWKIPSSYNNLLGDCIATSWGKNELACPIISIWEYFQERTIYWIFSGVVSWQWFVWLIISLWSIFALFYFFRKDIKSWLFKLLWSENRWIIKLFSRLLWILVLLIIIILLFIYL